MATDKQIAANRRNAQKSTGPKTKEGKVRTRKNALKHGLTAETVVQGPEDASEYEAFERAILADFAPATTIEQALVRRLASLLWRLKRAAAIETGLLQTQSMIVEALPDAYHEESSQKPSDPIAAFRKLLTVPYQIVSDHNSRAFKSVNGTSTKPNNVALEIAQAFLRLRGMTYCSFELVLRYETSLSRQLVQTSMCIAQMRQFTKYSHLVNRNTLRN